MKTNQACQPSAPRPQTQVQGMLNALRDEIDQLDKALSLHSECIQPVLRSIPPTPANGDKAEPMESLVSVADQLRTQCWRLAGLRHQLESMTERTEA